MVNLCSDDQLSFSLVAFHTSLMATRFEFILLRLDIKTAWNYADSQVHCLSVVSTSSTSLSDDPLQHPLQQQTIHLTKVESDMAELKGRLSWYSIQLHCVLNYIQLAHPYSARSTGLCIV